MVTEPVYMYGMLVHITLSLFVVLSWFLESWLLRLLLYLTIFRFWSHLIGPKTGSGLDSAQSQVGVLNKKVNLLFNKFKDNIYDNYYVSA